MKSFKERINEIARKNDKKIVLSFVFKEVK